MKPLIKLFLLSLVLVLLAACQPTNMVTSPDPIPQGDNRLSASDFTTAKSLFENNCQSCHVNAPVGPAFKGNLPSFTKVANGQSYLINALLFGVEGPITLGDQSFNGVMRSRANDFSDNEIALLLNYGLTGLGNDALLADDFKLITTAQVANERQTVKTKSEVLTLRNALELP